MTENTRGVEKRSSPILGPVDAGDRIQALDILRGFAVLGILAVNAIAFAWPGMMDTSSATVPFSMEGDNRWAIWVVDVFLHDKCRTLFSMLFGVSVFLVGGERSDRNRGAILRRRLLVLAAFGLLHGLALWFGDILLLYAWSGLFMALCRSWSPRRLLWVGGAMVGVFSLIVAAGEAIPALIHPGPSAAAFAETVVKGQAATLEIIQRVRTSWSGAMFENLKMWAMLQGASLLILVFPTVGLMMLGLGLFKTGYLAGRASGWAYVRALTIGIAILAAFGVVHWMVLDPAMAPKDVLVADSVLGALAPFITLAWVGLLILMTRHGLGIVTRRLAPVGRMAFTNYLSQTLIMTTLFYMPWGPRLFGSVEPAPLWGIVAAVWVVQLIWSPLWLSAFRMGPLEWVWRCLTYGRMVPIRN